MKWFSFLLVAMVFITGCGGDLLGKKIIDSANGDQGLEPIPEISPTPSPDGGLINIGGGTSDPSCFSNPSYDACVFYKNPVFVKGSAFSGGLKFSTDLAPYQIYGVKISGLNGSGFLENASLKVITGNSSVQRAQSSGANKWKFTYANDPNHRTGQMMAYYWLNRQIEVMEANSGKFYNKNRSTTVYTFLDGPQAAYSSGTNTIYIGSESGNEYALGADVYLHEAGHGNFAAAITRVTDTKSEQCGPNSCCTAASASRGCSVAINEGQADFHSVIMFPDATGLGESLLNSINGIVEAGINRDPRVNRSLTPAQANSAFGDSQGRGESHVLGRIYASIWYELRLAAGTNYREVEKLFTEHLNKLTSNDDFVTAKAKIKSTDAALFGGKYSSQIDAEFARHAL